MHNKPTIIDCEKTNKSSIPFIAWKLKYINQTKSPTEKPTKRW